MLEVGINKIKLEDRKTRRFVTLQRASTH